jgi:hypothetical protein
MSGMNTANPQQPSSRPQIVLNRHPDRSAQITLTVIPTEGEAGVEGPPHFAFALAVVCSRPHPPTHPLRHPDRSAQITLTVIPTEAKRSGGTPAFRLCPCCCLFSSAPTHPPPPSSRPKAKPEWRAPRIFFSRKPQQIRMSSPPTPINPHNSHSINHFPPKNSWHSSYAPLDTLNIWIKSIELWANARSHSSFSTE